MLAKVLFDDGTVVAMRLVGKPLDIHRLIRKLVGLADAKYIPFDKLIMMINTRHEKLRYNRAASNLLGRAVGGNVVVMSYQDWEENKGGFGIE